jgi:hypothetical protein
MLRIVIFPIALLIIPVTASKVDASYCGQVSELAAARQRWAAARQRADPTHTETSCRAYGNYFYEAVVARQAASVCEDGANRQQHLEMLDAEIDVFNDLIAAQCIGS